VVRRATLSFQLVLTKSGSGQESNPLDYTTAELEQCGASEHVMQVLGHRSCKHLHRHSKPPCTVLYNCAAANTRSGLQHRLLIDCVKSKATILSTSRSVLSLLRLSACLSARRADDPSKIKNAR
jgi:hypothetical protein